MVRFLRGHAHPEFGISESHQSTRHSQSVNRECKRNWAWLSDELIIGLFTLLFACVPAFAQIRKSKVPVLNKIVGAQHMAFSGVVTSLDMKLKVLSVERSKYNDVNMFPFKKALRIENADGKRLDPKALKPGTNVLIYYDQKAGERKITQVVVLGAEKNRTKKATPPAS